MIGSELALAGHDVTLISRGEQMAAIQAHGLTVMMNGKERHTTPYARIILYKPGHRML